MSESDALTALDAMTKYAVTKLNNIGDEITESDELASNVTVEGLKLIETLGWKMAEDMQRESKKWRLWLVRMGEGQPDADEEDDDL